MGQGNAVAQRLAVDQRCAVVEHFFKQCLPDTHHSATFVLTTADGWVYRPSGITTDNEFFDVDLAGLGIDLYFHGAPANLPKHALGFQGRSMIGLRLVKTIGGELKPGAAIMSHDQWCQRETLIALQHGPVVEPQIIGGALQLSGGKIQYLFLQLIDRTEAKRTSEEGRMYAEHWSGTRRVLYTPCSDEDLYIALTMLNSDAQAGQVPVDKALWRSSFPQLAGVIDRIGDQGRWDPFEVVRLSAWSNGRLTIIGDAANALPPNLGQGGGCAMMNALSLAVIVSRFDDVAAGLRKWERLERPLTDHTQRISLLYGRPTNWPPKLRAWAFGFAGRNSWLLKQRLKTANHIPTGT